MAQLPNVYSLLGQATTSEYNRRRKEERKYRRDIERDRLKASLLGMVLSPLAQSVTTGISGAIADRFGGRFEDFQLQEDAYLKQKTQNKEAYTFLQDFEDKQVKALKGAKSTEEYVRNTYLPGLIEDNVNREALKKYGKGATLQNIWKDDPVVKNEYLRSVADQVFDKSEVDNLVKIFDGVNAHYMSAPDRKLSMARMDKDIQKAIGRDGLFPELYRKVKRIKIEDSYSRGANVIKNHPFAQRVASILDFQSRLKAGEKYTPQEIVDAFEATAAARENAKNPDIVNMTKEIILDPADNLLKEKETTETVLAIPRWDEELGGLTNKKKETNITKVITDDDVLGYVGKQIQKAGTLNSLFQQLNDWAKTDVRDSFNDKYGKGSFERIMAASEIGFTDLTADKAPTGKLSAKPEEILDYYQELFKIMGQDGATNKQLVTAINNSYGLNKDLIDLNSQLTAAQLQLETDNTLKPNDPKKLSAEDRKELLEDIKKWKASIPAGVNMMTGNTATIAELIQRGTYP